MVITAIIINIKSERNREIIGDVKFLFFYLCL